MVDRLGPWAQLVCWVHGARLIPGLEETLAREKCRMELLDKLAVWTTQSSRAFIMNFTYWHLRTPYAWSESYRICRERILSDKSLPWQEEIDGR